MVAGNATELVGDVVIINYDVLHKFTDAVAAAKFDLVVVDECHYAKSKTARRSSSTYSAVASAPNTFWLTGTPIVNRPKRLLPLLRQSDPKSPTGPATGSVISRGTATRITTGTAGTLTVPPISNN